VQLHVLQHLQSSSLCCDPLRICYADSRVFHSALAAASIPLLLLLLTEGLLHAYTKEMLTIVVGAHVYWSGKGIRQPKT